MLEVSGDHFPVQVAYVDVDVGAQADYCRPASYHDTPMHPCET